MASLFTDLLICCTTYKSSLFDYDIVSVSSGKSRQKSTNQLDAENLEEGQGINEHHDLHV